MKVKILKRFLICIILAAAACIFALPSRVSADTGDAPQISSPSAILMDSTTGKILYDKNSRAKMYPASITKVMTAIVVLEHCNLNETVTVSHNAAT